MNYRSTRVLVAAILMSLSQVVYAQIPRIISYQGMAEKNGQPVLGSHLVRIVFYDSLIGGNVLFEESHQANFERGVFMVLLGSQVVFPPSLQFDKSYFLGVSLDGEPELSPRTMFVSAPYALHAERAKLANGLTTDAHGVVTSVNELTGSIRIVGDSTTSITHNGNEIRVHARLVTVGIKSLTSPDATIDITNNTGPSVEISVADNAITSSKLRDGAVILSKLAQEGATNGQIIKWNGSRWVVANDSGANYTAGQGISIVNNAISATGGLLAGTLLNSTLRWDGTKWIENVNLLSDANGNTQSRGTTTLGDGAGADNIIMKLGTGQVQIEGFGLGILKSNTTGVLSTGLLDLSSEVTGILSVSRGGTGVTSLPIGSFLVGNGTNPITSAALTAGTGITLTPGSGTMTISAAGWALLGNTGTSANTNFLGTTDNQDLVIKTNNAEALRVTTLGRIGIGTSLPSQKLELFNGNLLLSNTNNTAGEIRLAGPNSATYSGLKAGTQTANITYTLPLTEPIANQVLSATSVAGAGPYTVSLGWTTSLTSNDWSLTGNSSTTAGTNFLGTLDDEPFEIHVFENDAPNKGSKRVLRIEPKGLSANIIMGYNGNAVTNGAVGATISGGGEAGGSENTVTENFGTIGGGVTNTAGHGATVSGGGLNRATGVYSTIGGGAGSLAPERGATVSGGEGNVAEFNYASVGGGHLNVARAFSAIPGGSVLQLSDNSFGYNAGEGLSSKAANLISVGAHSHVAYFGNVDLWIGNTGSTARQLRFYEDNAGTTYPTSIHYSAFKAPSSYTSGSNIIYTLPVSQPIANQVLSATSISGSGPYDVTLGWTTNGGNAWNLTGNSGTTAGTNFLGTTDNQPIEIHAYNSYGTANQGTGRVLRIEPKTGANSSPNIIAGYQGNTVSSGVLGATISGGGYGTSFTNTVSANFGTVTGGYLNTASGGGSVVSGGTNTASGMVSAVVGGSNNGAFGNWSTVGGGYQNLTVGDYSFIAGGYNLRLGDHSFGFSGRSSSSSWGITYLTNYDNVAYFGNVDLMIGNSDGTSREVRFFGLTNQYYTNVNYVALKAGTPSVVASYTLPDTLPTATGNVLLSNANGIMNWSTGLVWDRANSRLGVSISSPSHPLHSVNSTTTDEKAAVYGNSSGSTTNQAVGVWGDASNTSSSNTGTIGVLATGNGNTSATQTNIALQVNDGGLAIGRTTETPTIGTVVAGAASGTAYSAEGPSGVIELTLGATGNLTTAVPTAGTPQNLGSVAVNNRYCAAGSIVLVNVIDFTDGGAAPDVHDAAFIVNVDNTATGSFDIRIKMIPTATNASNYTTTDKIRIGYIIVNPSK